MDPFLESSQGSEKPKTTKPWHVVAKGEAADYHDQGVLPGQGCETLLH